jgi:hypothetical protein
MTRGACLRGEKKKVALAALDRTPMWETTFPRLAHNTRRMQMPDVSDVCTVRCSQDACILSRDYKTLKSASKTHSERLVRPSNIFVWEG